MIRHYGRCFALPEFANYPTPKLTYKTDFIRGLFSDEEIEQFINLPYPFSKSGKFLVIWDMWSIFWMCLAYTGARPHEIANLTISDIDFGMGVFHITGKTGARDIPIASVIYDNLKEFTQTRRDTQLLFPSLTRKQQSVRKGAWEHNFIIRKKLLGIHRKHVSAYSFRHSFADRNIDENSIYRVKSIMGHTKITTTEKYLHNNRRKNIEVIENDPLSSGHKTAQEQLRVIQQYLRKIEEKYTDKIRTLLIPSDDGCEVQAIFQVRRRELRSPKEK